MARNPTFARDYTKTELANRISRLCDERDDLRAKLAAAQSELHDLRIRSGLAEQWQPTAAMWASVPEWCNWCVGNGGARLDFEEHEPQRVKDSGFRAGGWWATSGRPYHSDFELPIGIDWRLAKWRRPPETTA